MVCTIFRLGRRHCLDEQIEGDMPVLAHAKIGAEETGPDQGVAGNLFRPGERAVQDRAEKDGDAGDEGRCRYYERCGNGEHLIQDADHGEHVRGEAYCDLRMRSTHSAPYSLI